jgi:hypothetical protein
MEDKLKHQIEEWQNKWQHLQQLIEEDIKAEDYSGAVRMQTVATTLKGCIKDAYAILDPQK